MAKPLLFLCRKYQRPLRLKACGFSQRAKRSARKMRQQGAKRVGAPKVRCGFSPASAGMEKATAGSEASRSTEGALQAPHCFSTCRSVPSFAWLDRTDSKQTLALAVHCSIWWMSRCDGRVLEKNFMKTYCVRLAASAGAPEYASRVEFLRQKIKKPTMICDFFKKPET